eukprot:jgi/Ulvmu1/11659/UM008_0064.1
MGAMSAISPASAGMPWLQWLMTKLRTNPTLMAERHPNQLLVFFLSLCLPSIVFGLLIFTRGWGTDWHPFWYPPMVIYSLNIVWAPLLLRYSESQIRTHVLARIWCNGVMSVVILYLVIGIMLAGTTASCRAWLPFGDVTMSILAGYIELPTTILSEHVLFTHSTRPAGNAAAVLVQYALIGTRLEEARADIVFGARMLASGQAGACPYRGGENCLQHRLIASIIIVASVLDYLTEAAEMHLANIAPHVPLSVKLLRARIVKMACECATLAAILYFLLHGMSDYAAALPAGAAPSTAQAEAWRYGWMCVASTSLAVSHIAFSILVPDSVWVNVRLQARSMTQAATRRLSTAVGYGRLSQGGAARPAQVAPAPPGQGANEVRVGGEGFDLLDAQHGKRQGGVHATGVPCDQGQM